MSVFVLSPDFDVFYFQKGKKKSSGAVIVLKITFNMNFLLPGFIRGNELVVLRSEDNYVQ